MRSLSAINGVAACGTASAPSIWKWSSGMDRFRLLVRDRLSYFGAAGFQAQEEFVDMLPDFGSAGGSTPGHADESYELEGLVDGNDVGRVVGSDPGDEKRFDVGPHGLRGGMLRVYLPP